MSSINKNQNISNNIESYSFSFKKPTIQNSKLQLIIKKPNSNLKLTLPQKINCSLHYIKAGKFEMMPQISDGNLPMNLNANPFIANSVKNKMREIIGQEGSLLNKSLLKNSSTSRKSINQIRDQEISFKQNKLPKKYFNVNTVENSNNISMRKDYKIGKVFQKSKTEEKIKQIRKVIGNFSNYMSGVQRRTKGISFTQKPKVSGGKMMDTKELMDFEREFENIGYVSKRRNESTIGSNNNKYYFLNNINEFNTFDIDNVYQS